MLDLYQFELESGLELVEEDSGYINVSRLFFDKCNSNIGVGLILNYKGVYFEITELDYNRIKTVKISLK